MVPSARLTIPHSRGRDVALLCTAAFARSLGVGVLGVLLGIYLFRVGFSAEEIGLVIAAGLAGSAVATLLVSLRGDRFGRRRVLAALALLSAAGGLGLAWIPMRAALMPLAFIGMVNGMGTDRSASYALEQAIVPGLVGDERRTLALSWYNLVIDAGHALGALGAGLPMALHSLWGIPVLEAHRGIFIGYAALSLLSAILSICLPSAVEVSPKPSIPTAVVSPATRRIVKNLTALFALDALGGGLLTDALVSYWFFRRFGTTEAALGALFFGVHVLNAVSHLGAAWLSRRIGLLNTMVFTHLPSSLFLMAVPLAPTLPLAVALFLLREALVEMDVPTRQSYIAAVVRPEERTFASGMTNLARNTLWAVSSSFAGMLMQDVALAAPLLLGGGFKIVYDVLLYRAFREVKPPEEEAAIRSS